MNYKELKNLVKEHSELYYDSSAPVITDEEFDKLYTMLEAVETAQGWKAINSPTVRVGGTPGKVQHPYKLYSLKKVYDREDVDPLFKIKTPKIDGTNLTLIYKRGKLVAALTRGNGELGDNVLKVAKHITNIPTNIVTEWPLVVVNGECVTANEVDNFRNYVSGSLGLKSEEDFKSRNILFIAHDLLGVSLDYLPRMTITSNMGFTTVLDEEASKYPKDGVVYRINSYEKSQKLGYTSKFPKFAVALKPREVETALTTLQEVKWVVGRTGTVNPTGIIDPVVLEDATISRVTLHNIGIIEEHNLGIGDTIEIERAGGVIPKFLRVSEHSLHGIKISKNHAEKYLGHKVKRNGPKLMVADKNNISHAKILEHFIKILEIKGLGPASVKKMGFMHPIDLYEDNDWSILGANGAKVASEIKRSQSKPYSTVLTSLGIKGVGRTASKIIVTKLPSFHNLRDIEYMDIKGIGPSTVASILSWLDDNEEWVKTLPLQFTQEVHIKDLLDVPVRKICITGKLDMSRKELSEHLEQFGFKTASTVTKDCYALITGGDNSSSKYKKAIQQSTVVIDYWSSKKEVLKGEF